MSDVIFAIMLVSVLAAGVLGLLLVGALVVRYVQHFAAARRGVSTEVRCPRNGQLVTVRIGRRGSAPGLHVLSCERFPDNTLRCEAECFGGFTGARRAVVA